MLRIYHIPTCVIVIPSVYNYNSIYSYMPVPVYSFLAKYIVVFFIPIYSYLAS